MSKTAESFRIALEEEITRWSGFERALRKPEREAFDELMEMSRNYASENSNITNPIVFDQLVISILLSQQIRIMKLEAMLQEIKPNPSVPAECQAQNVVTEVKPDNNVQLAPSGGGGQSRLF
jgi:hypothetical protein